MTDSSADFYLVLDDDSDVFVGSYRPRGATPALVDLVFTDSPAQAHAWAESLSRGERPNSPADPGHLARNLPGGIPSSGP